MPPQLQKKLLWFLPAWIGCFAAMCFPQIFALGMCIACIGSLALMLPVLDGNLGRLEGGLLLGLGSSASALLGLLLRTCLNNG